MKKANNRALIGILWCCTALAGLITSCRTQPSMPVEAPQAWDHRMVRKLSQILPTRHVHRWEWKHLTIKAGTVCPNGDGGYLCTMNFSHSTAATIRKVPMLRCGEQMWRATNDTVSNARRLETFLAKCPCEQDSARRDSLQRAFVPPTTQTYIACHVNWIDEI